MATVNIGNIKFNWKGAYNGSTAYVVDDVVSNSGSSYICIQASTGNAPTNTTYWQQMSSAGSNGTDLTSTLTTQGDIVYRDGSGLATLGYGTAGQVLQTGGSGANPSWGTVSSDFVKLGSGTAVSGSSFNINGYFTSTYQTYKIMITGVNAWLKCRFNFGSSYTTYTGSNYVWQVMWGRRGASNEADSHSGSWNDSIIPLSYWSGDGSEEHYYIEATVYKPWDATNRAKAIQCTAMNYDSSNIYNHLNAGFLDANKYDEAMTGLHFFPTSGSETDWNWEIYGIK